MSSGLRLHGNLPGRGAIGIEAAGDAHSLPRPESQPWETSYPFRLPLAAKVHSLAAGEKQKLEILRQLYLRDGRTLSVTGAGSEELVEIRASSGLLELRIKMTEQGPVLQMESVRIHLKATESVDVEARQFNVKTEDGVALESQGEIKISGEADVRVDAKGEVHVNGTMIYLN